MCRSDEIEISVQNGSKLTAKVNVKKTMNTVNGEMNGSKKQEEDGTPATSR